MKLFILTAVLSICSGDKLDRTYLPPVGAKSAGGSQGSLQTPLGPSDGSASSSAFEGVAVDSAEFAPSGRFQASGLGAPGNTYGSQNSRVGEAAFRGAPSFTAQQKYGQNGLTGFSAPQNTQTSFGQSGHGNGIVNHQHQAPASYTPGQSVGGQNSYNTQSSSVPQQSYSQQSEQPQRPQASQDRAAEIIRQDSDVKSDGFNYSFETDNGIAAEENAVATNGVQAQGAFSYMGDDGQMYSVTYTADENGYHPQGAHLPTPPPIPEEILKSIEQNLRDEAAGIVDDGAYDAQKYGDEGQDLNAPAIQESGGASGQYSQYQRKQNATTGSNFGSQGVTQASYLPPSGSSPTSYGGSSQRYTQQGPASGSSQKFNAQSNQNPAQQFNASEKKGPSSYNTQSNLGLYQQSGAKNQGSNQYDGPSQEGSSLNKPNQNQQYTYKNNQQYNIQTQNEPKEYPKQGSSFEGPSQQQKTQVNRGFSGLNDDRNLGPGSSFQQFSSQKLNSDRYKDSINVKNQSETSGSAQQDSVQQGSSSIEGSSAPYNTQNKQGPSSSNQQSSSQQYKFQNGNQYNSQHQPEQLGSTNQDTSEQHNSQSDQTRKSSIPTQQIPSQHYNSQSSSQYNSQNQQTPNGPSQQGTYFQGSSQKYNAQSNGGLSSPTDQAPSQHYSTQRSQQYTAQNKPGSQVLGQQGSPLQDSSQLNDVQVTPGPSIGSFQQFNAHTNLEANNAPSSQSQSQQYKTPEGQFSQLNTQSNKFDQQYNAPAAISQQGASQQQSSQKYGQKSATFQSPSSKTANEYNTPFSTQSAQSQFNIQPSHSSQSPQFEKNSNSQTELAEISEGSDGPSSNSLFSPRPTGSASDNASPFASHSLDGFESTVSQGGNGFASQNQVSQKYTADSSGQNTHLSNDAYRYNAPTKPFHSPTPSQKISGAQKYSIGSQDVLSQSENVPSQFGNIPFQPNYPNAAFQGTKSQSYTLPKQYNSPSLEHSAGNQYNAQLQQNTLQTIGQSHEQTGPGQQNTPTQSSTSQQYSGEIYQYNKPESVNSSSSKDFSSVLKPQGSSQQIRTQPTQQFGTKITQQFVAQPTQQFGTQPTQQFDAQSTQQFGTQPTQQFGAQSTQQFGTQPTQQFGAQSTQQFGTQPTQQFGAQSTQQLGTQPTQQFGEQSTQQFGTQPTKQFSAQSKQQFGTQPTQQFNAQAPSQQYTQSQFNTGLSKSPAKEEFGGPRKPPSFSPESGYQY